VHLTNSFFAIDVLIFLNSSEFHLRMSKMKSKLFLINNKIQNWNCLLSSFCFQISSLYFINNQTSLTSSCCSFLKFLNVTNYMGSIKFDQWNVSHCYKFFIFALVDTRISIQSIFLTEPVCSVLHVHPTCKYKQITLQNFVSLTLNARSLQKWRHPLRLVFKIFFFYKSLIDLKNFTHVS